MNDARTRPSHIPQDAETTVQFLPEGTTLERLSAALAEEDLRCYGLVRLTQDRVHESEFPGRRYLFLSLQCTDLFGEGYQPPAWSGHVHVALEYNEEHRAAMAVLKVGSYAGRQSEMEVANNARVAWRLGLALAVSLSLGEDGPPGGAIR